MRKRLSGDVNVHFSCGCFGNLHYEVEDDPILLGPEEEAYFTDFLPCEDHDDVGADKIDAWEVVDYLVESTQSKDVEDFFENYENSEIAVEKPVDSFLMEEFLQEGKDVNQDERAETTPLQTKTKRTRKTVKAWKELLIADKFEQRLDGMDRIAYSLKEKISKEAWNEVKDLFYYDADCGDFLTLQPEEVVERLKDDEWKLETEVFQKIASEVSLNNAELLHECAKVVKKSTPQAVDLLRKTVKEVAGSEVSFSKGIKVISDVHDKHDNTKKILVEKGGQRYVVFLKWMASVDDAGYVGLVWREEDVRNADDKTLKEAVDLSVASALVFAPESVVVEKGEIQGKPYVIRRVKVNNPVKGVSKEFYEIALWHEKGNPDSYDHDVAQKVFNSRESAKKFVENLVKNSVKKTSFFAFKMKSKI